MPRPLRVLIWTAHSFFQVLPLAILASQAVRTLWRQMSDPAYARGRLAISAEQARWDLLLFAGGLLITLWALSGGRWSSYAYYGWTLCVWALVLNLPLQRDLVGLLAVLMSLSCAATCSLLLMAQRSSRP